MFNLREFEKKINGIETRRNVPMAQQTSFHVGGNADLVIFPASEMELQRVLRLLSAERTPYFVLGGGTNLIVADKGIREPVIATEKLKRIAVDGCRITAEAGARIEDVCLAALNAGLSGLEFLYKLPGSVGGAVRMNARCYERSTAEVLESVRYLKTDGSAHTLLPTDSDFGYKRSPFQNNGTVVLSAVFRLEPGDRIQIEAAMNAAESDRIQKGHFRFPSAGSIFKNDRRFGKPTGQLIDEAGLRGLTRGGAQIAPYHGNIIINTGGATAADICGLIETVEETVERNCGLRPEPETVFVGDFENAEENKQTR